MKKKKGTIEYHMERIICPECNTIQNAKVLHTWPWDTRIHECEVMVCQHKIMESDWQTTNE